MPDRCHIKHPVLVDGLANEKGRASAAAPIISLTMCRQVWLDTVRVFAVRLLIPQAFLHSSHIIFIPESSASSTVCGAWQYGEGY